MAEVTTATIVGVRLSLATAAVAGAVAVQQGVPLEAATWAGVKLVHVIFGAIGAAVMLSTVQGWDWWRVGMTLACGLSCASLGTPVAVHYLPPPPEIAAVLGNAYAAILGAVGVYLIPGLKRAAEAIGGNPFSFIDWVRGRGAAPSMPADPPPQKPPSSTEEGRP